jgi:xylulokinase
VTIGASYGGAYLAARTLDQTVDVDVWNPTKERVTPDPDTQALYEERYAAYLSLYPATKDLVHGLAAAHRER